MSEVAQPAGEDAGAPTAEEMEAGRLLFAREPRFMLGVAGLEQLPDTELPEVALAGRSNVGKSSLINALVNRHELARTSGTPGRTQQLNFFDLAGRLRLVDLPGYGYAKAPKAHVDAWQELIFAYLRGRPNLRIVALLVDARHGPMKVDTEVMTLLGKAAVPYRLVLTKTDLVGKGELAQRVSKIEAGLRSRVGAFPTLLSTSARRGEGIELLRAVLAGFAAAAIESV